MIDEEFKKELEKCAEIAKHIKIQRSLYYTMDSLLGYNWCTWMWLIGARGRGKSYAAMETVLRHYKKYGYDNVKCYYFRISDASVEAMLANKARKAIDIDLINKYGLQITRKGNTVYDHGHPIIDFYPLVSAAKKGKGVAEYSYDYLNKRPIDPKTGKPIKRFIFIILDEFMIAEGLEKKSIGNPVEQFKIYVENILRDQQHLDYAAVRIIGCANAVSECSDFLAQLAGFIPEKPGRYKLKRKHMVIDNIPNSDAYINHRATSIGADIMNYKDDSNYTNIIKRDIETLVPKNYRKQKVTAVIKFAKDKSHWYTIYDGNVIAKYTGQTCNNVIAMRRYLDTQFSTIMVSSVIERYDARTFLYTDLITQATFAAELKQIKK